MYSHVFFYWNEHIMIDLGMGNNKINWAIDNAQETIHIIETMFHGASSSAAIVSDFIRTVRIFQAKTTATDLLPQSTDNAHTGA